VNQLLRVQNFNVSRDGFGAGENQSLERPFGHANPGEMFAWAGATASWPMRTDPGGSRGLDDYLTRDYARNIGAEIMGRNKFGPQRGPWHDHAWRGWWEGEPPFASSGREPRGRRGLCGQRDAKQRTLWNIGPVICGPLRHRAGFFRVNACLVRAGGVRTGLLAGPADGAGVVVSPAWLRPRRFPGPEREMVVTGAQSAFSVLSSSKKLVS